MIHVGTYNLIDPILKGGKIKKINLSLFTCISIFSLYGGIMEGKRCDLSLDFPFIFFR